MRRRELELPTAVAFLIVAFGAAVGFLAIGTLGPTAPVVVILVQGALQLILL